MIAMLVGFYVGNLGCLKAMLSYVGNLECCKMIAMFVGFLLC